ncbi:hypothetical protein F5Y15DRAFT_379220 [Xylariaceae sp. FL0016]|nr:hypothetical protein F5Y15DRAFT_379220 [Xylariaceae sp. FL0016]
MQPSHPVISASLRYQRLRLVIKSLQSLHYLISLRLISENKAMRFSYFALHGLYGMLQSTAWASPLGAGHSVPFNDLLIDHPTGEDGRGNRDFSAAAGSDLSPGSSHADLLLRVEHEMGDDSQDDKMSRGVLPGSPLAARDDVTRCGFIGNLQNDTSGTLLCEAVTLAAVPQTCQLSYEASSSNTQQRMPIKGFGIFRDKNIADNNPCDGTNTDFALKLDGTVVDVVNIGCGATNQGNADFKFDIAAPEVVDKVSEALVGVQFTLGCSPV